MGRRQRAAPTQHSPPPPLQELDIAAFSELLRPSGLLIRDVANDGNCFFRAVSDQLYGSEHEHITLRQLACDYLLAHADHYKHFIDDEEHSFDEYVTEMRNDGVWADNLELQAISMACHVNIRVHQSGKPSYDIRNHPANNATTIHLSYHFGEHYASVRPLHTAELQLPAQHDPLPLPRPPTKRDHDESEPPPEEPSSNRGLRFRKHSDRHSVSAMWKRTERAHHDACTVVDKARRAAKNIRAAESSAKRASDAKNAAHNIEREMKAATKKLEAHFETIDSARSSYRKRALKAHKDSRRRRFTSASTSSQSDGSSTQPDDSSDDEQRYRDSVRRQTETIHEELLDIKSNARAALHVISQLEQQRTTQKKHAKSSKKREQEAKKKERKERRRRAQEKLASDEPEHIRASDIPQPHELDIAI